MPEPHSEKRALVGWCATLSDEGEGILTAAQIGAAYTAALLDFVGGKTSRAAIQTVLSLLKGALEVRRQLLLEEERASSQKVGNWY